MQRLAKKILWAAALTLAAATGCQLESNQPAPAPYLPGDVFDFMSVKPKVEYSLSDEVQAMRPDPLDAKPKSSQK